jgi:hypothetical protein
MGDSKQALCHPGQLPGERTVLGFGIRLSGTADSWWSYRRFTVSNFRYEGTKAASVPFSGSPGTLTQSVTTTAAACYKVQFYGGCYTTPVYADNPCRFTSTFGDGSVAGQVIFTGSGIAYTLFTYYGRAQGLQEDLQIGGIV